MHSLCSKPIEKLAYTLSSKPIVLWVITIRWMMLLCYVMFAKFLSCVNLKVQVMTRESRVVILKIRRKTNEGALRFESD